MRTPRQPDVKTADVALANLAKFFRTASRTETLRAWDVLTALRGPDSTENAGHKLATTAVIRAKFMSLGCDLKKPGLMDRLRGKIGASIYIDSDTQRAQRRLITPCTESSVLDGHFVHHAKRAFVALGLMWHSENKF